VTLPPLLLLLDYYFGRPARARLIVEKLPFFTLAAAFGAYALFVQGQYHDEWGIRTAPFWDRALWANLVLVTYAGKLFWPGALSCFYPYPQNVDGRLALFLYLAPLLTAGAAWLLWRFGRNNKLLVFGMLFFLLHITPLLSPKENFFLAERYVYVSGIGVFLAFAAGLRQCAEKFSRRACRTFLRASVAGCVFAFAMLSAERSLVWKDSETLYSDVLAKYPRALAIYNARGRYYFQIKEYARALSDFNRVIMLDPAFAQGYNNRASAYGKMGRRTDALADYNKAIALDPQYAKAYANPKNASGADGPGMTGQARSASARSHKRSSRAAAAKTQAAPARRRPALACSRATYPSRSICGRRSESFILP